MTKPTGGKIGRPPMNAAKDYDLPSRRFRILRFVCEVDHNGQPLHPALRRLANNRQKYILDEESQTGIDEQIRIGKFIGEYD